MVERSSGGFVGWRNHGKCDEICFRIDVALSRRPRFCSLEGNDLQIARSRVRADTGVKALGIFTIVCGAFETVWSLFVAGIGGLGWTAGLVTFSETTRSWGGGAFWGGLLGIVAGIVQIVTGFGVLGRRPWAWLLAGALAVLSLIHPIVGLLSGNLWSIFGLILPGIILYFLMQPNVKQIFGRGRAPV